MLTRGMKYVPDQELDNNSILNSGWSHRLSEESPFQSLNFDSACRPTGGPSGKMLAQLVVGSVASVVLRST